jgi:hypothetical protein
MGGKRPQSGTKIGKAERIQYSGSIGPGPGAYEYTYKGKSSNEVKIGTGQRNGGSRTDTPGPGAYEALKNGGKGVTISGYKGKHNIDVTPGPGAYELGEELKQRPCSAK